MIVTLSYLRTKFAEFNTLCFDSQLPVPQLRVGRSRTMLGNVRYKRQRKLFRKTTYTDFTISISSYYDMEEPLLEDTIIHEMIHYYILYFQIKDTSAHGDVFRRMMNEINEKYGRHVTISYRNPKKKGEGSEMTPVADTKKKTHVVIVSTMKDGSECITVPVASRAMIIMRELPKHYAIEAMRLYTTHNEFFVRFPHSRTPKLYRVDNQTLQTALTDAKEII